MLTIQAIEPGHSRIVYNSDIVGYLLRVNGWQYGPHWIAFTSQISENSRNASDPFAYILANKTGGMLYPTRKMAFTALETEFTGLRA